MTRRRDFDSRSQRRGGWGKRGQASTRQPMVSARGGDDDDDGEEEEE